MLKNRYEFLKGYENNHVTIGFGSYGQVKLARDIQTSEIVAVKIVWFFNFIGKINKLAKNEIIFHDKLTHERIIKLMDYQIDRKCEITYMVLEYADDGTLFEKIKTNPLTKSQIKKYFKDVCQAVSYLHSKQIMHRDIKPENILLTKKGIAKLCDFGFAALLGQRKTLCGTYQYMSPEMIQNKSYDYKIDIWALGILLFEMTAGHAPFRGESPEEVLNQMKTKIYFCERFEENQEINLIKMILRVTPHKRPQVKKILQHQFFHDDKKSSQTSDTQITNLKKLASTSSNSNLQSTKNNIHYQPGQFYKKHQQIESTKQPQNSFPFYIPKVKLNTGGTGSTGNSARNISNILIPPPTQQMPTRFEKMLQTEIISPKKLSQNQILPTEDLKMKYKLSKNNSQKYQKTSKNKLDLIGTGNPINYSIRADFKDKFNMIHGEQIQSLNNHENKVQKKAPNQVINTNPNKTFFTSINKPSSNRFS